MKPTIKVAVTDDQALFRECFVGIINSLKKIKVILEAENGKDLIEKISVSKEKPDIILLDLDMPVMNGVEATRELRSTFPDIKIIILSIHNEEKYVARMVQTGINGYLAKNAHLKEVRNAINSVYETGFYFNETVLKFLQASSDKKMISKKINFETEFTERELEILNLICREYTSPEIAEKLFISERTVHGHRDNLLLKTGSRNMAGLVIFAIENQLVDIDNLRRTD